MVADAITRHDLVDDFKDPELVQAIKDSAATLYAGDARSPLFTCIRCSLWLTTSSGSVETVCSTIFFVWDLGVTRR